MRACNNKLEGTVIARIGRSLSVGRVIGIGVALLATVIAGGCGSSGGNAPSTASTSATPSTAAAPTSTEAVAGDPVAAAKEFLSAVQNEANIKFEDFLPKTSPKAVTGKTIAVVENGAGAEGAVRAANGMKAAGEALGWTVKVTDGQFNPTVQSQAIQSAVTSNADGIILDSISPQTVGAAVAAAIAAKIPIVTTFNPNDEDGVFADVSNGTTDGGLALGAWISVHSNNAGKVVNVPDTSLVLTQQRADGVEQGLAKYCPGCDIVETDQNDIATMATRLPSLASSAIQKYGTDNLYMIAPFDSAALFLVQGAKDANQGTFPIVSMDGNKQAIEAIRDGNYIAATWAGAFEWMGWQAMDELNRAFNNEPAVPMAKVPNLLVDKSNLPASGADWAPDFDYQSAYKRLWGLG